MTEILKYIVRPLERKTFIWMTLVEFHCLTRLLTLGVLCMSLAPVAYGETSTPSTTTTTTSTTSLTTTTPSTSTGPTTPISTRTTTTRAPTTTPYTTTTTESPLTTELVTTIEATTAKVTTTFAPTSATTTTEPVTPIPTEPSTAPETTIEPTTVEEDTTIKTRAVTYTTTPTTVSPTTSITTTASTVTTPTNPTDETTAVGDTTTRSEDNIPPSNSVNTDTKQADQFANNDNSNQDSGFLNNTPVVVGAFVSAGVLLIGGSVGTIAVVKHLSGQGPASSKVGSSGITSMPPQQKPNGAEKPFFDKSRLPEVFVVCFLFCVLCSMLFILNGAIHEVDTRYRRKDG